MYELVYYSCMHSTSSYNTLHSKETTSSPKLMHRHTTIIAPIAFNLQKRAGFTSGALIPPWGLVKALSPVQSASHQAGPHANAYSPVSSSV